MAKYYVASGDLRTIIDAPNMMEALVGAFQKQAKGCTGLGEMTLISETGFDVDHEGAAFYPTAYILILAGIENQFQREPLGDGMP